MSAAGSHVPPIQWMPSPIDCSRIASPSVSGKVTVTACCLEVCSVHLSLSRHQFNIGGILLVNPSRGHGKPFHLRQPDMPSPPVSLLIKTSYASAPNISSVFGIGPCQKFRLRTRREPDDDRQLQLHCCRCSLHVLLTTNAESQHGSTRMSPSTPLWARQGWR